MVKFLILVIAWLLISGFLIIVTLNSPGGVFALQEVFPICQQITVLIYVFKIQIFSPLTIELFKKKKNEGIVDSCK